MFGVGERPMRMSRAEQAITGRRVDNEGIEDVARIVSEELEPQSDIHASAKYRKEVGGVMARRAFQMALAEARGDN